MVVSSILSDSFSELQNNPGALAGIGFSSTGAIQSDPVADSSGEAEPARAAIIKTIHINRILFSKRIIGEKRLGRADEARGANSGGAD